MRGLIRVLGFAAVAAGVVAIGLIYDLLFAGLPYQDPTPAMEARSELHRSVANFLYMMGACIFLIGLIAEPIIRMISRLKL